MELEQHKLISSRRTSLKGVIKDVATRMVPQPRRLSRDTRKRSKENLVTAGSSGKSLGSSRSGGISERRSGEQPGPSREASAVRSQSSLGSPAVEEVTISHN